MHRRALTASLAAGLLAAVLAPPVAAVDPIPGRPIPDEPPVTQLKDLVSASLVADLDADGAREVVAIATLDELRGFAAVQAWWVEDDGTVVASNQVRLPMALPSVRQSGASIPRRHADVVREGGSVNTVARPTTKSWSPGWQVRSNKWRNRRGSGGRGTLSGPNRSNGVPSHAPDRWHTAAEAVLLVYRL